MNTSNIILYRCIKWIKSVSKYICILNAVLLNFLITKEWCKGYEERYLYNLMIFNNNDNYYNFNLH